MEAFTLKKSGRDAPNLPNQIQPPSRNSIIFEELNTLVGNYKALENQLRLALDTPIKMIQIFRVAKSVLLNSHRGMDLRRSVQ